MSDRQRPILCAITLVAIGSGHLAVAQDARERLEELEKQFTTFNFGRSLVREVPTNNFVPVALDDLAHLARDVLSGVDNQLDLTLQPSCSPIRFEMRDGEMTFVPRSESRSPAVDNVHETGKLSVAVFAAWDPTQQDLVEVRWSFRGQMLRAVSSRNALKLETNSANLTRNGAFADFGDRPVDRARALAEAMIRMDGENTYREHYTIDLPWPDALEDGARLSSSPRSSIRTLMRWHHRVDVFVDGATLGFIFYMRNPQMMGFPDASKWFSQGFRSWVHKKEPGRSGGS